VLVPFDRPCCSRNALEYALKQFPDATVTALFVKSSLFEAYEPIESEDDIIAEDEAIDDETHNIFEMAANC
jgi:hypothetical protein